jgi:hypothetical protein
LGSKAFWFQKTGVKKSAWLRRPENQNQTLSCAIGPPNAKLKS